MALRSRQHFSASTRLTPRLSTEAVNSAWKSVQSIGFTENVGSSKLSLVALTTSVLTLTGSAAPVFSVVEDFFCLSARRVDTSLTTSWRFLCRDLS